MVCVHAQTVVSDSLWPHKEYSLQSPLSIGFPRQEYWSGLPFPFPGDLPDPGIKHESPTLAGGFFTTEPKYPYIWTISQMTVNKLFFKR